MARVPSRVARSPMIQASLADTALTLFRESLIPELGMGTRTQRVPFQCSTLVLAAGCPGKVPTAQASVGDSALTAATTLCAPPGTGTGVQLVPVQCSTTGDSPLA